MRIRVVLHPCQHLGLSVFLMLAILVGVKWLFTVVLMCISLMPNNIEHLSMSLSAIGLTSFVKCLCESFAHFKNWVVFSF